MAQHDYNIANQTAPSARTDINNALSAIVSNNSGTSAPATTFANMIWYDTTNNILQIRNEGNTAWITLGTVDQSNSKFEPNQTIATQAEAEAGSQSSKLMTSQRVAQAIDAQVVIPGGLGDSQYYAPGGRSINTWYQNSTGKPIFVWSRTGPSGGNNVRVGPSTGSYTSWSNNDGDSGTFDLGGFIVPKNYYYYVGSNSLNEWVELR
jgi:hypothetical protein